MLVRRQVRRAEVLRFFSSLQPCLVGMEACASAHHRGRELLALGHEVRLMPPAYVKPYVKRGKTDAADAEAICEVHRGTSGLGLSRSSAASKVPSFTSSRHATRLGAKRGMLDLIDGCPTMPS